MVCFCSKFCFAVLVCSTLALNGCRVPTFEHPLVDSADAEIPHDLIGSFVHVEDVEKIDPLLDLENDVDADEDTHEFHHIGMAGDDFPANFIRIVQVEVPT